MEESKANAVRQFNERIDEPLIDLLLSDNGKIEACFDTNNVHCPICQGDTIEIVETAEGDSERVYFQMRCPASDAQTGVVLSGTLNDKGMFYGYNTNKSAVKVFHIENWWGNVWKLTNGLFANYGKLLYKMVGDSQLDGSTVTNYNETGNGYIDSGVTISGSSGGCIKTMKLVPGLGLVPASVTGSNSTYYCDGGWFNVSATTLFARFGADSSDGLHCGAFACTLSIYLSNSWWFYGVSLSYKSAS